MPKTPDVYLINDPAPNAFAAGRNPEHAYVAATTGLIEKLTTRELEGVMAHEIAHIRNRDVRLMSLAAVLVGVIALVADMLMRDHALRRRPQPREQQPDHADRRHRRDDPRPHRRARCCRCRCPAAASTWPT